MESTEVKLRVETLNQLWGGLRFDDSWDLSSHVQIAPIISELNQAQIRFVEGEILKKDFLLLDKNLSSEFLNLLCEKIDVLKTKTVKRRDFKAALNLMEAQKELLDLIKKHKWKLSNSSPDYFSFEKEEGVIRYILTRDPIKDTVMYWYVLQMNPQPMIP